MLSEIQIAHLVIKLLKFTSQKSIDLQIKRSELKLFTRNTNIIKGEFLPFV